MFITQATCYRERKELGLEPEFLGFIDGPEDMEVWEVVESANRKFGEENLIVRF